MVSQYRLTCRKTAKSRSVTSSIATFMTFPFDDSPNLVRHFTNGTIGMNLSQTSRSTRRTMLRRIPRQEPASSASRQSLRRLLFLRARVMRPRYLPPPRPGPKADTAQEGESRPQRGRNHAAGSPLISPNGGRFLPKNLSPAPSRHKTRLGLVRVVPTDVADSTPKCRNPAHNFQVSNGKKVRHPSTQARNTQIASAVSGGTTVRAAGACSAPERLSGRQPGDNRSRQNGNLKQRCDDDVAIAIGDCDHRGGS